MRLYRFRLSRASITFACRPRDALQWASAFARWRGQELIAIDDLRAIQPRLELI